MIYFLPSIIFLKPYLCKNNENETNMGIFKTILIIYLVIAALDAIGHICILWFVKGLDERGRKDFRIEEDNFDFIKNNFSTACMNCTIHGLLWPMKFIRTRRVSEREDYD